jgi:hypothetical protein
VGNLAVMTILNKLAKMKCLRVPCPNCRAKPGEPCKVVGKLKGSPAPLCHDERVALSREDASQAAARIVREATEK